METRTFDDVFDALSDTPAEAANMKARADLLAVLARQVKSWGLPQEAAAARLGITRPRLNDLLRNIVAKHSGQDEEKLRRDFDRDFFMNAEQAKEYGIIDEVLAPREGAVAVG